ncbi:hypothetical protein OROGR_031636 [Orobanche gracilis]
MGKQFIIFILFCIAIIMAQANGFANEDWFQTTLNQKEKVTHLQLYVQDIFSGPVPTTIPVASANSTSSSPTLFGRAAVLDDPVRTEPNTTAEIVGRAQGFFAYTSLEEISIHMTYDLIFTGGPYNGSALNLIGSNQLLRPYRELSVAGGSGAFRLARGCVEIRSVSTNSTGVAFFQYNITVLHYVPANTM